MKFAIPLFIESYRPSGLKVAHYTVRPLFATEPEHTDGMLGRATGRCIGDLRKQIERLGRDGDHAAVAKLAFNPEVAQHRLKLAIELRQETVRAAFAFYVFRIGGCKVGYTPSFPDEWFELRRGDSLEQRARQVIQTKLRRRESREESAAVFVREIALNGKPWVTVAEFDANVAQNFERKPNDLLAALLDDRPPDGTMELERVGRCLDRLYPQQLERAHLRDPEVSELERLLRERDRRPVLLVGPRLSGKTTLIHECVFRRVEERGSAYHSRNNVWLLSPQRLISGMMYVGQWESRLDALFKEARRRDHVLYFDDLVGTFRAGISRESNLSVAHLLKTELLDRKVRILGEVTPAQLRVLREQDRAFADAFHVIPVHEPDEETTRRVLLSVIRRSEQTLGCRFGLDVLPTVVDLCRRYESAAAFPGKGAMVLMRLAARFKGQSITRESVLEDFHRSSGLRLEFLDDRRTLERKRIVASISESLVGQSAAVHAVGDALTLAKARLNDPDRPLGCFLFVGPTGVGKTECAKAVARTLFGQAERMIRFDMNEYVSPFSAAQLVGTFDRPDGLLTSAVAREPFAVILLDELEKAHPDVFDLLLQVMGEGRLTDASGRTVDFTNTLILMTSNIGTREAAGQVGYASQEQNRESVYLRAVEEFFRPEFVNRLDQVVPFAPLTHADVLSIARLILGKIVTREGFQRRRCIVSVSDEALTGVVREGFHPRWGARGVRRALERQLVRPAARLLSATDAATPVIISFALRDGAVKTVVCPLIEAEPVVGRIANRSPMPVPETLVRLKRTLARLTDRVRQARPQGTIVAGTITPEQARTLETAEFLNGLREACGTLEAAYADDVESRLRLEDGRAVSGTRMTRLPSLTRFLASKIAGPGRGRRIIMSEIASARDIHDYFDGLFAPIGLDPQDAGEAAVNRLLSLSAAAEAVGPHDSGWPEETLLLTMRGLPESAGFVERLRSNYAAGLNFSLRPEDRDARCVIGPERWAEPGVPGDGQIPTFAPPDLRARLRDAHSAAVLFRGSGLRHLLDGEQGFHLQILPDGSIGAARVALHPVASVDDAEAALRAFLDSLSSVSIAEACGGGIPAVVRLYEADGRIVDVRTGLRSQSAKYSHEHQAVEEFVLAALPLPGEFQEVGTE